MVGSGVVCWGVVQLGCCLGGLRWGLMHEYARTARKLQATCGIPSGSISRRAPYGHWWLLVDMRLRNCKAFRR